MNKKLSFFYFEKMFQATYNCEFAARISYNTSLKAKFLFIEVWWKSCLDFFQYFKNFFSLICSSRIQLQSLKIPKSAKMKIERNKHEGNKLEKIWKPFSKTFCYKQANAYLNIGLFAVFLCSLILKSMHLPI